MDKNQTKDRSMSIIIPCYNEEAVIKDRIMDCMGLSYDYPLEIIVVDDLSTDGTLHAAKQCPSNPYPLTVVRNCHQKGKSGAMITGIERAKGKIVCITDADVFFESDLLVKSVLLFDNPKVGLVTGHKRIVQKDSSGSNIKLVPKSSLYYLFRNFTVNFYSWLDSTPCVRGPVMIFRKDLDVVFRAGVRTDDFDIALQIRKKGFRCVAANVYYMEPELTSFDEWKTQTYRRGIGLVQHFDENKDVLFDPRLGLYGLFIYPLEFSAYLFQPFIVGLSLLGACVYLSYQELYFGVIFVSGLVGTIWLIKPVRTYLYWNYLVGKAVYDYYMKPDTTTSDSWETPER